jgi:Aerotolerance regulator N-terminal
VNEYAMTFATPMLLLALLPWTAVVLYLLRGKRTPTTVPFLALWGRSASMAKPSRSLHRPPVFLVLMMLAMLLAIVAAAGPGRWGTGGHVTIILDRGITMSPVTAGGQKFRGVIDRANAELIHHVGYRTVDLLPVPGEEVQSDSEKWADLVAGYSPTALDTQGAIESAVNDRLRDPSSGLILVLTDRHLTVTNDRLLQIAPDAVVNDVGIAAIAARATRRAQGGQVMVRLRNSSPLREVSLRVISGDRTIASTQQLPPSGQTRDYFIDVSNLAESVRVEIDPHDQASVNDRAWLVREKSWPIIDRMTPLPAAVGRMIDVYAKLRPGDAASPHVAVGERALAAGERGVEIVGADAGGDTMSPVIEASHPITANVSHWPAAADAAVAPPAGFSPIVLRGGKTLVAMGKGQAWVNLDLQSWATSPDLVIFFTNLFDWLGQTTEPRYASHAPELLGVDWQRVDDSPAPGGIKAGEWPGLYRRSDGVIRAINAPDVAWSNAENDDGLPKLSTAAASGESMTNLAPIVCIAAIALVAMAAAMAPKRTI